MSKDIEIIDNTHDHECYKCLGSGKAEGTICSTCNGTGVWKEEHFYLVDHKHKIAFDIDSPGK